MRYEIGQTLFAVQFNFAADLEAGRIGMFRQPLLYSDEMPVAINIEKMVVTEHHRVYWDQDDKRQGAPEYDGFILVGEDGKKWANQYPDASYGQISDTANRRFNLYTDIAGLDDNQIKAKERELIDKLKADKGSYYETHLLTDVFGPIMRGIKDLGEVAPHESHYKIAQTKLALLIQLKDQILEKFAEAYPEYRLQERWIKLYAGALKDYPLPIIYHRIPVDEAHQLSIEQIAAEVNANDRLDIVYPNGDYLNVEREIGSYHIHGELTDVDHLRVMYAEKTVEEGQNGESFYVTAAEYFHPEDVAIAAHCMLIRVASGRAHVATRLGHSIDTIAEKHSIAQVLNVKQEHMEHHLLPGKTWEVKYAYGYKLSLENRGEEGYHLMYSIPTGLPNSNEMCSVHSYVLPEVTPQVAFMTLQEVVRAVKSDPSSMSSKIYLEALHKASAMQVHGNCVDVE